MQVAGLQTKFFQDFHLIKQILTLTKVPLMDYVTAQNGSKILIIVQQGQFELVYFRCSESINFAKKMSHTYSLNATGKRLHKRFLCMMIISILFSVS